MNSFEDGSLLSSLSLLFLLLLLFISCILLCLIWLANNMARKIEWKCDLWMNGFENFFLWWIEMDVYRDCYACLIAVEFFTWLVFDWFDVNLEMFKLKPSSKMSNFWIFNGKLTKKITLIHKVKKMSSNPKV